MIRVFLILASFSLSRRIRSKQYIGIVCNNFNMVMFVNFTKKGNAFGYRMRLYRLYGNRAGIGMA